MNSSTILYKDILKAKLTGNKLLAILIDPDKIIWENLDELVVNIKRSPATHLLIGGSLVTNNILYDLIAKIKKNLSLPIILFPGHPSQISANADGILFLSLLSGRNPDYLIEYHVQAAPILKKTNLEIIPTAYLLIESGSQTAVERVSNTTPISRTDNDRVLATCQAGEMLGNKLVYLEAGSGAMHSVPIEMISLVSENVLIPVIVGGGIIHLRGIQDAYNAGADMVVIGTAFEKDTEFFNKYSVHKILDLK